MSNLCLINGKIITGFMEINNGALIIKNGKISEILNEEQFYETEISNDTSIIDVKGSIIAPGFIDTHIHGIGGAGTENGEEQEILQMSKTLTKYGVTTFCPTVYPDDEKNILNSISAIVKSMGKEQGARIAGIHLEGPFISRDKKGVQKPEHMQDVNIDLMMKLDSQARGNIKIMTVAPELKGMQELANFCTQKGIKLSAGHTNATYEDMLEGMQFGIMHSTHFFNAMRKLHHRDPGCVGAILIHPEISCEIIADGFHLHPAIIEHLVKQKPLSKIILVTDSLRPTKQTEGKLLANNEEVYLSDDGVFRRKTDDIIAGSALTMIDGLRNLVKWGISVSNGVKMASSNPATIINEEKNRGRLLPGYKADITVFTSDYNVLLTIIEGEIKYNGF